jgi:hypothetical protein
VTPRQTQALVHVDVRRPVASTYGQAALDAECARVFAMGEGGRNHQLNASAYSLARLVAGGYLARVDVEDGLRAAALGAGLTEREALQTIASGIRGGLQAGARHPVERVQRWDDPFGGAEIVIAGDGQDRDKAGQVDAVAVVEEEAATEATKQRAAEQAEDDARHALLAKVRDLGGLCESYCAWVVRGADHAQPALTIASLLVLGGAMFARRLVYRRQTTGLYVVALGESASGKGRPQACLDRVLVDLWPRLRGPSSFSSAASLTDVVNTATMNGVGLGLILDEYGMQLASMLGPRASSHRQDIKGILTEIATKGTSTWSPSISLARGGGAQRILAPCLSVLGSTTPESLHAVLSGVDVADGFAGRHLWLSAQATLPPWQDPDRAGDDAIPQSVAAAVAGIRARHEAWVDALPTDGATSTGEPLRLYHPLPVAETPEAAAALRAHKEACDGRRRSRSGDVPHAVLGRAPEYAVRVAAILAGLAQPDADVPTVELAHVESAIGIVEESSRTLASSLARHQRAAWNDPQAQLEAVERAIRRLGGEATKREILRSCRSLTARTLAEIISRLEDEGAAVIEDKVTAGRTAKVLRLVSRL